MKFNQITGNYCMFLKQKLNLLSYKFEYFFRIMECACQDEDGNVQEHALWALRLYFRNAQCKKVIYFFLFLLYTLY